MMTNMMTYNMMRNQKPIMKTIMKAKVTTNLKKK
jgi:hypothetical protein